MARGITESDVHCAADALVADGKRPTVERIRAYLGTGSPNTVVRWLETWWQNLGRRLANNDQLSVATANVPEAVATLAGQWWALALEHARVQANEAMTLERADLLDARVALDHERQSMQAELVHAREQTETAQHAERLAETRGIELERLVALLQGQIDELRRQNDASAVRIAEVEAAREVLQLQLQQLQDAARVERDTLARHVRARKMQRRPDAIIKKRLSTQRQPLPAFGRNSRFKRLERTPWNLSWAS